MTITELEQSSLNPGLAYVIGLIFPFYKTGKDNKGNEFVKGCVNYNSVTEEALAAHFRSVLALLNENNLSSLQLLSNKQEEFSVSPKKGFSVLIYKENQKDDKCLDILLKKVNEIKKSENPQIQKEFMKGCFDGRGSFDTTMHFLSIDTDRDYERQNLIKEIFAQSNIDLNLNQRSMDYDKHDQIRIRPKDLQYFLNKIGLFNVMKKRQIENFLN